MECVHKILHLLKEPNRTHSNRLSLLWLQPCLPLKVVSLHFKQKQDWQIFLSDYKHNAYIIKEFIFPKLPSFLLNTHWSNVEFGFIRIKKLKFKISQNFKFWKAKKRTLNWLERSKYAIYSCLWKILLHLFIFI